MRKSESYYFPVEHISALSVDALQPAHLCAKGILIHFYACSMLRILP